MPPLFPFSRARAMLSPGMLRERAFKTAVRTPGAFPSPPAFFDSTAIRLASFENARLLRASTAAFLCFTFDHLLCPDIRFREVRVGYLFSARYQGGRTRALLQCVRVVCAR